MTARSRPRRGEVSQWLVLGALLVMTGPDRLAGQVMLPGTQPADGSGDPAFPAFRDLALPGELDDPGQCILCHAGYRTFGQPVHEPVDSWQGSMMANSARDPLFWAALDIANQDDADHLGNVGVGDFCLRCHVPKAWYEGRSTCSTAWGQRFDGSCLNGTPGREDNDFEGITCHYCHRMYDASNPPAGEFADPQAPRVGNAQVYLASDPDVMRGPRSDAMPGSGNHAFAHSTFQQQASFCGQCHDVTNPVRNRRDPTTGLDLGYPMPIERTYTEYTSSRFADASAPEHATCQECHMPAPDLDGDGQPDAAFASVQQIGLRGDSTPLEGPFRTHFLAGANSWMLRVLRDEYGRFLRRQEEFDAGIAATLDLLTTRTVDVDLTTPVSVTAGQDVMATVRVTNQAGHKFPTGYPEGRRAWIEVNAGEDLDGNGALDPAEVTFRSGDWDPATGVLTEDPQVKIYELKIGVWNFNGTGQCDLIDDGNGRKMFHFVLNDCIVEDNRIPPLGFVPQPETAPVAYTYPANPALPGTLANWDDTGYTIPVPPGATRDFLVETSVLYQSTSNDYVDFLRDENRSTCDPFDTGCDPTLPDAGLNRGEKVHDLWTRYERAPPVVLGTTLAAISVQPLPTGACCDTFCMELTEPDCTSRGGTYEGDGAPCAMAPCPPVPPGEPSRMSTGDSPFLVSKGAGTTLDLSWDPACDATDHVVHWGPIAGVSGYAYSGAHCAAGVSGAVTVDPGPGSWFILVVGDNGVVEGSYGRDVDGRERGASSGVAPCDLPVDRIANCN